MPWRTCRPMDERLNRATGFGSEERYDTVCDLPVPLRLPVEGQVAAHAA